MASRSSPVRREPVRLTAGRESTISGAGIEQKRTQHGKTEEARARRWRKVNHQRREILENEANLWKRNRTRWRGAGPQCNVSVANCQTRSNTVRASQGWRLRGGNSRTRRRGDLKVENDTPAGRRFHQGRNSKSDLAITRMRLSNAGAGGGRHRGRQRFSCPRTHF